MHGLLVEKNIQISVLFMLSLSSPTMVDMYFFHWLLPGIQLKDLRPATVEMKQ